jgi:sulfur-carrier protein
VRVHIPTPLRSYTNGASEIDVTLPADSTVDALLAAIDAEFPGLAFRVRDEQGRLRQHMKVFVNGELRRDLTTTIADTDEVMLLQALSGG